jgi:glyoxylase-like metal-dependent hydrolase (beta-lactamase superfamily II)
MMTNTSNENYRFDLGSLKCTIVRDGSMAYPYPATNIFINYFANATAARLRQALEKHKLDPEQWEEYVSPYSALLIDTGEEKILVDTGAGDFAPTTGKLIPNLQAEGITPGDIDIVVLTHCHLDHIGGALDDRRKPAFPRARYIMLKDEWEFWTTEKAAEAVARLMIEDEHLKEGLVEFPLRNLPSLQDQLELIDHKKEISPGIKALVAPGHTPGHMVVSIVSGGKQLVYLSDTALHPIHLEQPDWYSAVAINPHQAVATRSQILKKAATGETMVHASHFPFPSIGCVTKEGDRWKWKPAR